MKTSKIKSWKLILGAIVGLATAGSAMAFSHDMSRDAITERIKPVAQVKIAAGDTASVGTAASEGRSGEAVYNQFCIACHGVGVLNAPRKGNGDDWGPRLEQGMDVVIKHGIEGLNAMPPKGSCMDCSDDEIIAAIDFMLEGIE